ncbi:MAG: 5-methyltetrahydropteroyltriglutamate--homocysteine methyltransferase, partial [Gemmataceae bacterium]
MASDLPWQAIHTHAAQVRFDGGDLDCGNGLLLLIRQHLGPLDAGALLELISREKSVEEDLPSWSRLTGNALVSCVRLEQGVSYLLSKGAFNPAATPVAAPGSPTVNLGEVKPGPRLGVPGPIVPIPPLPPLAVTGIGSWPRPGWLLYLQSCKLDGRPGGFLALDGQASGNGHGLVEMLAAGVDLVTDGEQARENYAAFVGARLGSCRLVPVTDLVP